MGRPLYQALEPGIYDRIVTSAKSSYGRSNVSSVTEHVKGIRNNLAELTGNNLHRMTNVVLAAFERIPVKSAVIAQETRYDLLLSKHRYRKLARVKQIPRPGTVRG